VEKSGFYILIRDWGWSAEPHVTTFYSRDEERPGGEVGDFKLRCYFNRLVNLITSAKTLVYCLLAAFSIG